MVLTDIKQILRNFSPLYGHMGTKKKEERTNRILKLYTNLLKDLKVSYSDNFYMQQSFFFFK